jgi:hypothetical protein
MVSLTTQSDFRKVRNLPFCYVCGNQFATDDLCDNDHVPPKTIFRKSDRLPLKLKTHKTCNELHSGDDENVGQLIGAMDGGFPGDPKKQRLRVSHIGPSVGGITNLNVDAAIWRWVRGCHAGLYLEPLLTNSFSIVSPFPRADQIEGGPFRIRPILPQHPLFVEIIKTQRMHGALDRIETNKRNFIFECVWAKSDDATKWICMFAIKIYDWKRLGTTPLGPHRGCAGCYVLDAAPASATRVTDWNVVHPNLDHLDPFGA